VSTVTLEIRGADGQPTTITFNDVTIWEADADGRWRVAVDSANRTAPLQTPPSLSRP
jgi:ketosteroid isomerase-like protein